MGSSTVSEESYKDYAGKIRKMSVGSHSSQEEDITKIYTMLGEGYDAMMGHVHYNDPFVLVDVVTNFRQEGSPLDRE